MNQVNDANAQITRPLPAAGRARKKFSLRHMRLQTRLILLLLVISVPVIVISNLLLTFQAQRFIRQNMVDRLQQNNQALYSKTTTWLSMNVSVLHQMAVFDDIVSMDAGKQRPLLEKTSASFPHLFLVHTLDLTGSNVARSDNEANREYGDRDWFAGAVSGAPLTTQVVISRTINQPVLSLSAPVKDSSGQVVGVMALTSDLTDISKEVLALGETYDEGKLLSYIVDQTNHVIAHPNPEFIETGSDLADFSSFPPVAALREGRRGEFEFTDDQGRHWMAYLTQMDNGWGIITQADTQVGLAPIYLYWRTTSMVIAISAIILAGLAWLMVRRSMRPMNELTETVARISAGNLSLEAQVASEDEVGQLARAFNEMTAQVRENIGSLENRVAERTRALTLSAEISRRLSTILNLDQLTREVVNQVQRTFGYYHVHIYLFDESRSNLVMVGGSGEAGQVMLAQGHKIPAGKGLVGRAAGTNQSVLVSSTARDPRWLPNPLLPETKSELSVPIALGENVMGVLDVQQDVIGGLAQADVEIIESIANQVAVAVQNARAYSTVKEQAERDELISSISMKIQSAASIDEVLQVAVSELGRALGAQQSSVELRSQAAFSERISSREG